MKDLRLARLLAAACALVSGTPAHALVGRTTEAPGLAPHVVTVLSRDGSRAGFCSGVVVGARAVLTAAHCVRSAGDTRVLVRGADASPSLLTVAAVTRHPGYRPDAVAARVRSVDLAVVTLADPLPTSFTPVRIAPGSEAIGAAFQLAGVGVAREGEARSGGTLRTGAVALRAPPSQLLLWLNGEAAACTGDSGGGVFGPDGTLVGIIAFAQGSGAKGCGTLTQAVRVAPFAAWVRASGE